MCTLTAHSPETGYTLGRYPAEMSRRSDRVRASTNRSSVKNSVSQKPRSSVPRIRPERPASGSPDRALLPGREEISHAYGGPEALVEVIRRHYDQPNARTGTTDSRPPRVRPQDWQIVEEISLGSADYILLRRLPSRGNALDSLTVRERDVLRHACAGASNKEIAYELGISHSTVRVLLSRAGRKVGVRHRAHLLQAYSATPVRNDPSLL